VYSQVCCALSTFICIFNRVLKETGAVGGATTTTASGHASTGVSSGASHSTPTASAARATGSSGASSNSVRVGGLVAALAAVFAMLS